MGQNSWNGYERNCLFLNDGGNGQFIDIARASGGDEIRDSRGVAIADFDGDGRLDLAMNNNNNVPALYWNRIDNGSHFLGVELLGRQGNTDAVGAKVSLTFESRDGASKTSTRWVEAGSGYASQSSHLVHFGLGAAPRLKALEIHWPSGQVDHFEAASLEVDRTLRIAEGGELLASTPAHSRALSSTPLPEATSSQDSDTTLDQTAFVLGTDAAVDSSPETAPQSGDPPRRSRES